jgi:hypothetical protein
MDVAPVEVKQHSGVQSAPAVLDPAGEVATPSPLRPDPLQGGSTYVYNIGTGTGKTFLYVGMSDYAQKAGRVNRLRDATDLAHTVRDTLNKHGAAENSLTLRIKAHVGPIGRSDFESNGVFSLCMPSHWDDGPGAPWQALPYYTNRPFVPRSCCGASVLTRELLAIGKTPRAPVCGIELHEFAHRLMWDPVYRLIYQPPAPLMVTIRDKQIAEDYRAGLRCLLVGVLDALGSLIVMFLAALAHLAQAPSFLLVMLAVARHYGRRGESDDHFLLTPRAQPMRPRGAACLAA